MRITLSSRNTLLLLSLSPQPTRLAESGQTHVPEYSSKCKPEVHLISIASPSMQLKNTLQMAASGWAKNPFLLGHNRLLFGGSVHKRRYIRYALLKLQQKNVPRASTYVIQFCPRNQRWTVDRICSSVELFRQIPNHLGTVFRWTRLLCTHSICRIVHHLCIVCIFALGIRIFGRLQSKEEMFW